MEQENDVIQIRPASREQYVEALWLLNDPLDEPQRKTEVAAIVQGVGAGETTLEFLFVALRDDSIVGVVYGSPLPGRVAIVKPAQLAAGESNALAIALHDKLEQSLRAAGIELMQALVDVRWSGCIKRLSKAGFDKTAYLKYLICEAVEFPDQAPSLPFAVSTYSESRRQELMGLIDQTYLDTKDFPVLNNCRDLDDVLVGYQ
ncbi:MAG: hypothetical protein ACI9HK_004035, partial [Pirellulaceae bacterium]